MEHLSLHGLSSAVDRKEDPSNLESVLLDQKMRVEKHRMNFETLKSQHILLQEAHAKLQVDRDVLNEELQRMEKRSEEIISTLQRERDEKIAECEQLQSQVLTPEKMEEVRADLVRELEGPYRKYLGELENELDSFKSDYNKLKYNYSYLKSEYESRAEQHRAEMGEVMAKHEAQLSQLAGQKKELMARLQRDIPGEVKRMRLLQRENSELSQKVSMLTIELEEGREKALSSEADSKKTIGSLRKDLEEAKVEKKVIEEEKLVLEDQIHYLKDEIEQAHEQTSQVRRECAEKDSCVTQLNRKIESLLHDHKVQMSELQISHAQLRKQCDQEKIKLIDQLNKAEKEHTLLQKAFGDQQERLIAKSQEIDDCVMRAREEEWSKISTLQQDLAEAKEKADQMEMENKQLILSHKQEVETLMKTSAVFEEKVRTLELEVSALKRECSECEQKLNSMKKIQKENSSLTIQVSSLEQSVRDLQDERDRLQNALEMTSQELSVAKEDLSRVRANHSREMEEVQRSATEEKTRLQHELEACMRDLSALQVKNDQSQAETKRRVKEYRRRAHSLAHEVERLKAELEKSKLEMDHMEKAYKLESRKNQGKLKSLHRQHQQLLAMLNQAPGPRISTPSLPPPFPKDSHSMVELLDSLSERLHLGNTGHLKEPSDTDTVSNGTNVD